jgi:hypothetical protein
MGRETEPSAEAHAPESNSVADEPDMLPPASPGEHGEYEAEAGEYHEEQEGEYYEETGEYYDEAGETGGYEEHVEAGTYDGGDAEYDDMIYGNSAETNADTAQEMDT